MQSQENFVADKVIGIIVMILSVCGVLGGIAIIAGMGLLGVAASSAASEGGAGAADAAAAAGVFGMTGALLGGLFLVMSGVNFVVGLGIMKSAKWGFLVGSIWNGLGTIMNLVSFNIFGLLVSGGLLAYCVLRLTGQVGPKPA